LEVDLTDQQIERYARHIILQDVGGVGQTKLLQSKVLVVGAGGLGSPLSMYLAAAGVGRIGLVDDDHVSLSNLQRQIAHTSEAVGNAKVESAAQTLRALNPDVRLDCHPNRANSDNVMQLIADYDVIADGSDNFETRFLLNDACFFARKTLVSAAVLRFDGQLSTYKPHAGVDHPCYRCVFPEAPPPDLIPSCAEGGVLGALVGVMGSLQATEVIKELLAIGDSMSGRLMIYDGLRAEFRNVRLKPDPNCALCSDAATIKNLDRQTA
jgi:adenylyltransferase/sulfurtransferase